jgi:predicted RNase H-like HicB family nuclease
MHSNFTAIVEKDGDWYISYCAEIPGANGQGKTKEDCLKNFAEAIELILEDRGQDSLRSIPSDELIIDSFSDKQFHCLSEKL